jgi:hypothetical protein
MRTGLAFRLIDWERLGVNRAMMRAFSASSEIGIPPDVEV